MARKALSRYENELKKELNKVLCEYSAQAVKNIIKIATCALDQNTRLKANIFLLDRVLGKEYVVLQDEQKDQNNEFKINVRVVDGTEVDYDEVEKEISETETEQERNGFYADEEIWTVNDSDEWGEDTYSSM